MFLSREDLQEIENERARYTIAVLNLNRELLRVARRDAYGAYRARLYEYRARRDSGARKVDLRILRDAIKSGVHPTLWREMQRQHSAIDELRSLFSDVPEALSW